MNPENPKVPAPAPAPTEAAGPNPEIDAFFERLPSNLRWPPPSAAAIAAAVEAIQRMQGAELDDPQPGQHSTAADFEPSRSLCSGCGQALRNGNRFCGNCGLPVDTTSTPEQEPGSPARDLSSRGLEIQGPSNEGGVGTRQVQHHYHHHYHHFVGTPGSTPALQPQETSVAQGRASSLSAPGSRAELAARQVAQDWAQSCNIKHLDDLLELYSSDATLIRPNVPPVRSIPAIREFLFGSLEAGLGEVEMESLRTEIFGEIALDLGRCKMLVPVTMGKRREERGKYLLLMARQPAGHWKIVADCWSTDLVVSPTTTPETARKPGEAAVKKTR